MIINHTDEQQWVLEALDKSQLVEEKQRKRTGLRHFGRGIVALMWLLRLYVVLMLLLVAHQAWTIVVR